LSARQIWIQAVFFGIRRIFRLAGGWYHSRCFKNRPQLVLFPDKQILLPKKMTSEYGAFNHCVRFEQKLKNLFV
jgi:hypothetical protein